jgi:hypothetical protein
MPKKAKKKKEKKKHLSGAVEVERGGSRWLKEMYGGMER